MEKLTLNLSEVKENMIPYNLVQKIYEFNDNLIENEIEFDKIIVSEDVLDIIDVINFIYSKEPTYKDKIYKVGLLRNFEVFVDPDKKDNTIIFTNNNKDIGELEIIF